MTSSYDIIANIKNLEEVVLVLRYLQPDMYISAVNKVDTKKLASMGIRALVLDVDNTLLPWRERTVNHLLVKTLKRFSSKGFKICIVSNARDKKIKELFKALNIPIISKAGKPRKRAFIKALDILGVDSTETAVIGDQVFTDILGGNRAGLFTILVTPMSNREFIGTKMARGVEKRILKHFIKKGVIIKPD